MEKILTITIPSYNVEKYLQQTLDSFIDDEILNDIEVLVVDDGSKDRTATIGKAYEEKYPDTFRVISKENGGHGSTINRGIQEAKGKYFKVVDGDDWVYTEDFIKLVKALKTCNADYIVTNYYEVNDKTGEKTPREYREFQKKDIWKFSEAAQVKQIGMHPLVIKTEILKKNQIRLDEHCFYVDVEYILYPVPYVETVQYLDLFVYMYRLAVTTQSVSLAGYQKHMQKDVYKRQDIKSMNVLDIVPYHYAKRMEGSLTTKFVPDYYPLHRRRIAMLYEQQQLWHTDTEETCAILGSLYGRYILSALERNCDKRAEMNHRDRKAFCKTVFADRLFVKLMPKARARDSKALKFALFCMKRKSVFLCTTLARAVHIIRSGLPMVYSKVKSNR